MGWLITAGYFVVAVAAWRLMFSLILDLAKKKHDERNRYKPHRIKWQRAEEATEAIFVGAVAGLFWPLVVAALPIVFLGKWVARPTRNEAKDQQRAEERAELKRLRAQAKELGLPMGDQ